MRNNNKPRAIALLLLLTFATSIFVLPAAKAQAYTKKTYPYIGAMPNPVGVGQETLLHFGISDATAWPQPGWYGMTVTITKPDGKTETLGPFTTDTTGGTGTVYIPMTAGTYYVQANFPEQRIQYTAGGVPANTTMLASTSEKLALIATEQTRTYYPDEPLPTEFWTRPVDAQLRSWSAVASNWLTTPTNRFAPYNDAPESPHILWAIPLAEGGLAGGELGQNNYETGDAYEGKFTGNVVINGVLYFHRQITQTSMTAFNSTLVEQQVVAVDLKTGKELWTKVLGNNERVSFGQVMYWQTMNLYGAYAYLWTVDGTTWRAYDPLTGRWEWSIRDVPTGTSVYGPNGEILRYITDLTNGWVAQWNSTSACYKTYLDYYLSRPSDAPLAEYYAQRWRPFGIVFNASKGYDWNKTIPRGLPGSANAFFYDDRIMGGLINSTGRLVDQPIAIWAISLKRGQEGTLLFNTTWQPPAGGLTLAFGARSVADRVITVRAKEIRAFFGFSMDTGQYLWGPTESRPYMDLFMGGPSGESGMIAYGKLFLGTVAGVLQCIDVKTGKLLWSYDVTQPYTELMWGGDKWPIEFAFISGGKVYLLHSEHSGNSPLPRGAPFVCLNATTGEVVFRVDGLFRFTVWGGDPIIADSTTVIFNTYDNRIYGVGKGPSAITVEAPQIVQPIGTPIIIKGMVTDVSAGAQEYARTARFPNGVPAVADENMGEWMKYVYQQFPRPTNAKGVEVVLSVLDANGNFREIGKTTSDSYGFYSFMWTPDIPGKYTLVADFAGSKSYWPSRAETAFGAMEAPSAPAEPEPAPPSMTDTYVLGIGVAIIIAIAVVGAVILFSLKKKS